MYILNLINHHFLIEVQGEISGFEACKLKLFRRGYLRGDPVHTLTNESIDEKMRHRIKEGPRIKSVSNGKGTWAVYWYVNCK